MFQVPCVPADGETGIASPAPFKLHVAALNSAARTRQAAATEIQRSHRQRNARTIRAAQLYGEAELLLSQVMACNSYGL